MSDLEIARFKSSYEGVGLMLRMPAIAEEIAKRAENVKNVAEQLAPVGDEATDPHSGRYKESFEIEIQPRGGGVRHDRVRAIVRNTSPEALFVEKGTSTQEAYHILLRSLQAAR